MGKANVWSARTSRVKGVEWNPNVLLQSMYLLLALTSDARESPIGVRDRAEVAVVGEPRGGVRRLAVVDGCARTVGSRTPSLGVFGEVDGMQADEAPVVHNREVVAKGVSVDGNSRH